MDINTFKSAIDKIRNCECMAEDEYYLLMHVADKNTGEGKKARRAFYLSSLNDHKALSFLTDRDEDREEYYSEYGRKYQ